MCCATSVFLRFGHAHIRPSVYHEGKTSEIHKVAIYKYGTVRTCAL